MNHMNNQNYKDYKDFKNANEIESSSASVEYIKKSTESEKIKILYGHLNFSLLSSFICSSIIFYTVHGLGSALYNNWYIAIIAISIFRFSFFVIYKFTPQYTRLHTIFFIIGAGLGASCLGVIGSFLMPEQDLLRQTIIITIIAGVSAGAMQTLQANLVATLLFLSLTVLPLNIWLFMQNIFEYYALGMAVTMYLIFCTASAFKGSRLIDQFLKLNFRNIDLLSRLYHSNAALLTKNDQLERQEKDMNVVNQMNERLQQCKSSIEAYAVIKTAAELLFIDFSGGLTISDLAENQNVVIEWGNQKTLTVQFSSEECCGLRNGVKYIAKEAEMNLFCTHYLSSPEGSYCMPLIVEDKPIGMINFNFSNKTIMTNHIMQMMAVFGDVIKLGLSNIQLQEKLLLEATHDPLTELYNRRYLNEVLSREFPRLIREKKPLCLAILDLDNFKKFNDTYGHEAGDTVLKHIATLLVNNVRKSDIVSRFGGEEFVLLFIDTTIEKVMPSLERIRQEIEKTKIYFHQELLPKITISMGVAQAPEHGISINEITRAADMALYTAKEISKNRVVVAETTNATINRLL